MIKILFLYLISLIAGFAFGVFRRVSNQKKTKGVITDLKQKDRNQSGRITYTGIVTYTVNKKEYQVETDFQSSSYHKGKEVIVCYNEDNPCESYVRAAVIVYLFVYILMLLGTALLLKEITIIFSRG